MYSSMDGHLPAAGWPPSPQGGLITSHLSHQPASPYCVVPAAVRRLLSVCVCLRHSVEPFFPVSVAVSSASTQRNIFSANLSYAGLCFVKLRAILRPTEEEVVRSSWSVCIFVYLSACL